MARALSVFALAMALELAKAEDEGMCESDCLFISSHFHL